VLVRSKFEPLICEYERAAGAHACAMEREDVRGHAGMRCQEAAVSEWERGKMPEKAAHQVAGVRRARASSARRAEQKQRQTRSRLSRRMARGREPAHRPQSEMLCEAEVGAREETVVRAREKRVALYAVQTSAPPGRCWRRAKQASSIRPMFLRQRQEKVSQRSMKPGEAAAAARLRTPTLRSEVRPTSRC